MARLICWLRGHRDVDTGKTLAYFHGATRWRAAKLVCLCCKRWCLGARRDF